MKHLVFPFLTLLASSCQSQPALQTAPDNNTLLWEVTGKGLAKPSYVYGTMHILCAEDAGISPALAQVMEQASAVYFEIDLDNLMEVFGSLKEMNMKHETKLRDLLTEEEYNRVKDYMSKNLPLPFSMVENYKPMLLSSLVAEKSMDCGEANGMELVMLEKATKLNKEIKGLETAGYQAGLFDSIPYKEQAQELVRSLDHEGEQDKTVDSLVAAYRTQNLAELERLSTSEEGGMSKYLDLLLFKRNRNWAEKFPEISKNGSVLMAVGAGHLPGNQGLLQLLRKMGYTLRPIKNVWQGNPA
jgi:uncharacterized protein YbaP (TraB family)